MSRTIRPEFTDRVRRLDFDSEYIPFFNEAYFAGNHFGDVFGYDDYHQCREILETWAAMVHKLFRPASVLDVGAAYGFVVNYFRKVGVEAEGVEPSEFARAQAVTPLHCGYLPNHMPNLGRTYDVVTCTEVMEHMPVGLVPDALATLTKYCHGYIIILAAMGAEDEYQEDPTHINIRPRDWWTEQVSAVSGWEPHEQLTRLLDIHPYSKSMDWSGRFLVLAKIKNG